MLLRSTAPGLDCSCNSIAPGQEHDSCKACLPRLVRQLLTRIITLQSVGITLRFSEVFPVFFFLASSAEFLETALRPSRSRSSFLREGHNPHARPTESCVHGTLSSAQKERPVQRPRWIARSRSMTAAESVSVTDHSCRNSHLQKVESPHVITYDYKIQPQHARPSSPSTPSFFSFVRGRSRRRRLDF